MIASSSVASLLQSRSSWASSVRLVRFAVAVEPSSSSISKVGSASVPATVLATQVQSTFHALL
eukprot:scaffold609_cov234-Pinguiococcus_pyrenoidosus.AAC.14